MFKVPEQYRANLPMGHPYWSMKAELNGIFYIPIGKDNFLFCLGTPGDDEIPWEHVSVTVKKNKKGKIHELNRCPTWEEMCKVKDAFWDKEDTVVQFHPPESEYVSHHHYCLHL